MAKRASKNSGLTPEEQAWLDARDFFNALDELEKKRGIKKEYMMEKIRQALASAYEKNFNTRKVRSDFPEDGEAGEGQQTPPAESSASKKARGLGLVVLMNEQEKSIRMLLKREVVETVDDPECEIALEEVRPILHNAQLGDIVSKEIKPKNFGRIAAQTARQVVIQGVREAERNMVYDEFKGKAQELVIGTITRIDNRSGTVYVRLQSNGISADAQLSPNDQVEGESYTVGQPLQVYIVDIRQGTKHGTQVIASRTHFGLVRRLFEKEVPEVSDGIVEIKSTAREAGSRTKIAVWSNDPDVDAVGACVGLNGSRVNAIVRELCKAGREKIDIVNWDDNPGELIKNALSPAKITAVFADPEERSAKVVVPDYQLSLAIGKEGQNARLAAKLTGYRIDIKNETQAKDAVGFRYEDYEDYDEYDEEYDEEAYAEDADGEVVSDGEEYAGEYSEEYTEE